MAKERDAHVSSEQPEKWQTGITFTAPGIIAPRGYRIEELMGRITFTDVMHLMYCGELPDDATRALLDAVLVASIDHSTTSPSAMTARTVASSGAGVQLAATAGLLAINDNHGGALGPCMIVLGEVIKRTVDGDIQSSADALVAEWQARGERLPGFGHRVHAEDPRTSRLFAIAESLGFHTVYNDAARAVETALNSNPAKRIPMNLDGAIAAVLCGIGFPAELANPLFMTARFVGITMQAYEEHTRHRPMRKIYLDRWEYDGQPLREVPGASA
jgi:citrate synthase